MASFSDTFATNPSSRWVLALWTSHAVIYQSGPQNVVCPTDGGYAAYNTATGSATHYGKVRLAYTNPYGGIVLRSTGAGSGGYYFVVHYNGNVIFGRGTDGGWAADMTQSALSFVQNDTIAVTIDGTGTSTTARVWKNPTNNTPVDAQNWDSASDPPDVTLTASGGTYYDTGQYVGVGIDYTSATFDDFYGGSTTSGTTSIDVSLTDGVLQVTPF